MAITIRTQPIDGETWPSATTTDSAHVLQTATGQKNASIMQSSIGAGETAFTPTTNGLVDAVLTAWNNHHHLVLRPDDVWLAITSQLGFFINAHAEDLRHLFVAHEGKKELSVEQFTDPDHADYGRFAKQMSDELARNVVDPDLVPWIMPNFSTTTDTDRVVGSVLLMGAMQQYFKYSFSCCTCGIPSVTLLGERSDWVDLQARVDRIARLGGGGGEADECHKRLVPIARHMVLSFDEPRSNDVLKFWRAIASRERPRYGGSGGPTEFVSGWITAFCFWKPDGKRNDFREYAVDSAYVIHGVRYPPLEPQAKVNGWASVPVTVRTLDGGAGGAVVETRKCRMFAGSVGMEPGQHSMMGVQLEGIPSPPLEIGGDEEEEKKVLEKKVEENGEDDDDMYDDYDPDRPETEKERRKRWRQIKVVRDLDAPSASLGFDAVRPRVAWWILNETQT